MSFYLSKSSFADFYDDEILVWLTCSLRSGSKVTQNKVAVLSKVVQERGKACDFLC